MSGETLAGQDTPVADEAQTLTPQEPATPEPQTDGGAEEKESPPPKTFTQAELEAIVARERAKAERKAFREVRQQLQPARQEPAEPGQEPERPQITREMIEAHIAQQRAEDAKVTFVEKLEEATDRYPDLIQTVSDPRLPFTEQVIEFLADSDVGVDVAHWLARHPSEFAGIVRMSPLKAGRELTRIEAEIKAKPKATPSKAPEPINPVGARGPSRTSTQPSDEDDVDTWMRKERERLSRRG